MTNYIVGAGQTKTYHLSGDDTATVSSGGTSDDTYVYGGGSASLIILAGGHGEGTVLSSGGFEFVGGTDSGVFTDNGFQDVGSGGQELGGNFTDYSNQTIETGGYASGGTYSGLITPTGIGVSDQVIYSGGLASGAVLQGGAEQFISAGGLAVNTTATGQFNAVNFRGGALLVSGVNDRLAAEIAGRGLLETRGGGTILTIAPDPSYLLTVGSDVPFTGEAVLGSGTQLELTQTNALGAGTILFDQFADGVLTIDGNTTPTETIGNFVSGDTIILTGVSISGAQVSDGLVQLFLTNGGEDDITIADAHPAGVGIFTPGNGNVVLSSYLVPTEVTTDGDTITDATLTDYEVANGGTVTVGDAGSAVNGYYGSATLDVQSGGTASGNIINSGGVEDIKSGGTSTNDQIGVGGQETVEAGAVAVDAEFDYSYWTVDGNAYFNTPPANGASNEVGTLAGSGTVAVGAGTFVVGGDAGQFTGTLVLTGSSTVEIATNVALNATASIDFNAGTSDPTVQIDAPLVYLPAAVISGFSTPLDVIDLRSFGYSSNTVSTPFSVYQGAAIATSGGGTVLDVTTGGTPYSLNLDPATTGAGPINLADDGQGGTDFSLSPLSASDANTLSAGIVSAASLSDGTYTIFLTNDVTLTSDGGETGTLDPIQAQNGATVILNGEGHGLTFGDGSEDLLLFGGGPTALTSLGGFIDIGVVSGARVTVASDTYGGGTIITSGTLEVATSGGAGPASIVFDPQGGRETLTIDAAAMPVNGGVFSNTLNAFSDGSGQYLDVAGLAFNSGQTAATLVGQVLEVTNGATAIDFVIQNNGSNTFNTFDDMNGGTIVTADSTACYVTGTLILTETGERPVENLAIGERVVTASGALRPIQWIGRRSYGGRFLASRAGLLPICIQAGALAAGIPRRDLFVSPKHAMFLDGVLVPAEALLNGATIVQARRMDTVGYWHIELDSHDILLAEGAPSESFLDDGSRAMFDNAANYALLYPNPAPRGGYCAPRIDAGYKLAAIRQSLAGAVSRAA